MANLGAKPWRVGGAHVGLVLLAVGQVGERAKPNFENGVVLLGGKEGARVWRSGGENKKGSSMAKKTQKKNRKRERERGGGERDKEKEETPLVNTQPSGEREGERAREVCM